MGYGSWGHKELDMTERLFTFSQVGHSFSSKEQASFNFMAAVTICSDLSQRPFNQLLLLSSRKKKK